MEGLWKYVYQNGEWFWQLPMVVTILSLFEGCLFLWFVGSFKEHSNHLWSNLIQKVLFLALCIFLQFQHFHVVYHSPTVVTGKKLFFPVQYSV